MSPSPEPPFQTKKTFKLIENFTLSYLDYCAFSKNSTTSHNTHSLNLWRRRLAPLPLVTVNFLLVSRPNTKYLSISNMCVLHIVAPLQLNHN